jgi:hypothetical protein
MRNGFTVMSEWKMKHFSIEYFEAQGVCIVSPEKNKKSPLGCVHIDKPPMRNDS